MVKVNALVGAVTELLFARRGETGCYRCHQTDTRVRMGGILCSDCYDELKDGLFDEDVQLALDGGEVEGVRFEAVAIACPECARFRRRFNITDGEVAIRKIVGEEDGYHILECGHLVKA